LTPAYACTDYQSQGQTIDNTIIDIRTLPSGELTPFSIYIALSRGHVEDQRLVELDEATEKWWRTHVNAN
ncbi:hypothetical protein BDR03DRAFT_881488, partial [Suillus americanus]